MRRRRGRLVPGVVVPAAPLVFLVAPLVVLAVLGLGDVSRAEILSADLRVNGMACPFCAFGIEKKLLDVDGVRNVEVGLDEGRLRLGLEPGNSATTAALEAAVEKAGFALAGLTIEVRGRLDVEGAGTWLEAGAGPRFLLLEAEGDGTRPLTPASRVRLPADAHDRFVVSGRVVGEADAPRLVVDPTAPPAERAP